MQVNSPVTPQHLRIDLSKIGQGGRLSGRIHAGGIEVPVRDADGRPTSRDSRLLTQMKMMRAESVV